MYGTSHVLRRVDQDDLDGDGTIELPNTSGANAGVSFYSGTSEVFYVPFSVLRRIDEGVALEIVLEFPSDIQYWLDLQGLDNSDVDSIFASVRSFFDVDGDGLRDALLRVTSYLVDGQTQITKTYWYRNQLNPPDARLSGDVNNDGQVNGADLTVVLSDWTG